MNTINRRHFATLIGASAIFPAATLAQDHDSHHGDATPGASTAVGCSVDHGTPQIVPYESDIPFDRAYIDTMIPHHNSVVDLATAALDVLEDDRLVTIAQSVIDTQPGEIEQLKSFREEWYGEAEPDEMTEEMMMVTMGNMENMEDCSSDDDMGDHDMDMDDHNMDMSDDGMDMTNHDDMMNLMDSEWILGEFERAENKDLAFIDLVIPHHQMAVHQSMVGLQLAEHEELRTLCQEVIDAQEAEITELKEIREDLEA